eukprot:403340798
MQSNQTTVAHIKIEKFDNTLDDTIFSSKQQTFAQSNRKLIGNRSDLNLIHNELMHNQIMIDSESVGSRTNTQRDYQTQPLFIESLTVSKTKRGPIRRERGSFKYSPAKGTSKNNQSIQDDKNSAKILTIEEQRSPLIQLDSLSESFIKMSETERNLFRLVNYNQIYEVKSYLQKCPRMNITRLVDSQGFSLLHQAAYKNYFEIAQILCEYVNISNLNLLCLQVLNTKFESWEYSAKDLLKQYINSQSKNDEGFTTLHFASFHGNMDMIRYFIQHGADIFARNKHNINMLHVSAQGDQAVGIAFYLEKGININCKDSRQSTPLHWACYSGAENSIGYLLAWGSDVNAVDLNGLTPLHLAIKSTEETQSTRTVRHLLIKGASREALDNLGRKPIDLVEDVKDGLLRHELSHLLRVPKSYQCFNFSTPLVKVEKSKNTVVMQIIFLLLSFDIFWRVIQIVFGISFLSLIITWNKDPGYLKQDKSLDFNNTLELLIPAQLCPECQVIRTDRSRHCNICKRCVDRFDHHCPWINNCVGVKNHGIFYLYIVFTITYVVLATSICVQTLYRIYFTDNDDTNGRSKLDELIQEDSEILDKVFIFIQSDIFLSFAAMLLIAAGIFFVIPLMQVQT